eukprot:scaffold126207_cov61-Cyclotella_meneghiniana.AAC.1
MVLGGRTHRSQAITKKTQQQHSSVLPYKTVLCSFVNQDPCGKINTGTERVAPMAALNSVLRLRVFDHGSTWTAIEDKDFVAVPTEIGQKCGPAGVAQNF